MQTAKLLTAGMIMALVAFNTVTDAAPADRGPSSDHPEGTIVAMGDSLTAGYGVPEKEAYPAQLARKLQAAGYRYQVINAGVSGETSSGALSRVNWVLRLKPDIVVVETGANDGMRGIDPKVLEKNLNRIVEELQKNRVTVVLAGMEMFRNLGQSYLREFTDVYHRVAAKHGLILVPFFLKGVAGDPALNQGDRIHPTAAGYRIVTDTVYPYVVKAIEKKRTK